MNGIDFHREVFHDAACYGEVKPFHLPTSRRQCRSSETHDYPTRFVCAATFVHKKPTTQRLIQYNEYKI